MAENTQYQCVKEITDKLEAGIQDIFQSEQYRDWLTTMSRFHNYSLNNTILIAQQKPDATLVAGYTAWQKNFGRQVSKNEKAIRILAPAPYKKKSQFDKIDPRTGELLLNPDGSVQKETREVQVPAFKIAYVFDISQTEGQDLPTIGVDELTGDVKQYELFYKALEKSSPVPIGFEDIQNGSKGYFSPSENRIALRQGMSQVQTIKTLIHEMAHQRLHAIDPAIPNTDNIKLSRNAKEVEAESVAFTVCEHFGIDTSEYSFAYIAGWSQGKDTPELKASMNRIRNTASALITEISNHFQMLQKEYTLSHLTAADIKNVKCLLTLPIPLDRMVQHDFSFEVLGQKYLGVYTVSQHDDCPGFTIDTEGIDIWERLPESELQKLSYVLDSAVEVHYWEDRVNNIQTVDDIMQLGDDLIYSEGSKMTVEQRNAVYDAFDAKKREILEQTQEGRAEMLAVDLVYLLHQAHPLPFEQQYEPMADMPELKQQLLDGAPELLPIIKDLQDMGASENDAISSRSQDLLERVAEFLGYGHPLILQAEGKEAYEPTAGLQENGLYRYYSTQRPISLGTYPKEDQKPITIENFNERKPIDANMQAWGYLEYKQPLTQQQQRSYELKPAPTVAKQAQRTSLVDRLREKQAEVKAPSPKRTQKVKEECR